MARFSCQNSKSLVHVQSQHSLFKLDVRHLNSTLVTQIRHSSFISTFVIQLHICQSRHFKRFQSRHFKLDIRYSNSTFAIQIRYSNKLVPSTKLQGERRLGEKNMFDETKEAFRSRVHSKPVSNCIVSVQIVVLKCIHQFCLRNVWKHFFKNFQGILIKNKMKTLNSTMCIGRYQ